MHPLGLSRATLVDGFPMLLNPFQYPTILLASKNGFKINPSTWPLKGGYPAVASKRAQVLTYSITHFFVCLFLFNSLSLSYPSLLLTLLP